MNKWEYLTRGVKFNGKELTFTVISQGGGATQDFSIDELGRLGWELVQVIVMPASSLAIFKRESAISA